MHTGRWLSLFVVVSLILGHARLARADEPVSAGPTNAEETDPSTRELTRLRLTIDGLGDDAKERRYDRATASALVGVVGVGAAVALSVGPGDSSTDATRAAGGAALGLGISAGTAAIALRFFYEDPHEKLRDAVEREMNRGLSSAETIDAIDAEWKAAAERERARRFIAGGIVVAAGAAVSVSGALIPELTHASARGGASTYLGGVLTGAGSVMVLLGGELLFLPAPIETSYQTRSLGAPRAGAAGGLGSRVQIGAGALPGGGAMQLGLSF